MLNPRSCGRGQHSFAILEKLSKKSRLTSFYQSHNKLETSNPFAICRRGCLFTAPLRSNLLSVLLQLPTIRRQFNDSSMSKAGWLDCFLLVLSLCTLYRNTETLNLSCIKKCWSLDTFVFSCGWFIEECDRSVRWCENTLLSMKQGSLNKDNLIWGTSFDIRFLICRNISKIMVWNSTVFLWTPLCLLFLRYSVENSKSPEIWNAGDDQWQTYRNWEDKINSRGRIHKA